MSLAADRSALAWPGAPLAIGAAVLFGASTPLAKLLLQAIDPWLLAGLLYLGSGCGLAVLHVARRLVGLPAAEAPLRWSDLPWLGAVIVAGGVIGPLLLMLGLTRTAASSAALLLNLEGLATMAIAWVVFRENVDRRILLGALAILGGALLLSWRGGPAGLGWGSVAIAGACLAWGIDNNLTRKLSAADPVQIAMAKGLVAGAVNLALALAHGAVWPPAASVRTSAYFSLAPFIGALLSLALFPAAPTLAFCVAALLMGAGVVLHLAERHEHEHLHEAMEHEHRHVHDAHHRHAHSADDPPGEPHVHRHAHAPLRHKHPHYPDLHHRHGHAH